MVRNLYRSWVSELFRAGMVGIAFCGALLYAHGAKAGADQVVGPNQCAECHKAAVEVWRGTRHFSLLADRPKSKEAGKILDNMGLKRMQSAPLCLGCHFTVIEEKGKKKPDVVAGVSCESCHGPAEGWNKKHAEYAGGKKEAETPDDAARRWAKAERAGMIRPGNVYGWARNCQTCHTIADEKLVNVGGHRTGEGFDLVAWSQGSVRHNFAPLPGSENRETTPERKRVRHLVGLAVELESALRAMAMAEEKGAYSKGMAERAAKALQAIDKAAGALKVSELNEMAAAGKGAAPTVGNGPAMIAAADKIAAAAKAFAEKHDGKNLGAVDSMLPAQKDYKGKPALMIDTLGN